MLWNDLLASMSRIQDEFGDSPYFWTDGESIMCESEPLATMLAVFLESAGLKVVTGYYDPEEDGLNGESDDYTGYWYVDLN